MDLIFDVIAQIKRGLDTSRSDRLSFYVTPILLAVFAAFVLGYEFVGDPISCWFPAYYTGTL